MITGLRHAHMGLGYLLVLSCSLSLTLAVLNGVLGSHPALIKAGTVLQRRVEPALMGIIALMGIAAWVLLGLPIASIYLWVGVVAVVAQGMLVGMMTKPALLALAAGDAEARWKWVGAAAINAVVIFGVFGAMQAKP